MEIWGDTRTIPSLRWVRGEEQGTRSRTWLDLSGDFRLYPARAAGDDGAAAPQHSQPRQVCLPMAQAANRIPTCVNSTCCAGMLAQYPYGSSLLHVLSWVPLTSPKDWMVPHCPPQHHAKQHPPSSPGTPAALPYLHS